MRRMIFIIAAVAVTVLGYGQRSVDNLFKKYSNNDGYFSITISGNLLKLADLFDNKKDGTDQHKWQSEIDEIRILARDGENKEGANFYDMVIKGIDRGQYEEFMKVKKKDQYLIILVRAEGRNFKEFLLVAGGEDNVVIQIKGNLTMKDARKISSEFRDDHDMDLTSYQN